MATTATMVASIGQVIASGNAVMGIDPIDFKVLYQAAANGQRAVELTSPDIIQWPSMIPALGNYMSVVLPTMNYAKSFVAVTSSQAGSLIVSRFADRGGTVKVDDTTQSMSANFQASVALTDGKFCQGLQIRVSNTAAVPAILTGQLAAVSL